MSYATTYVPYQNEQLFVFMHHLNTWIKSAVAYLGLSDFYKPSLHLHIAGSAVTLSSVYKYGFWPHSRKTKTLQSKNGWNKNYSDIAIDWSYAPLIYFPMETTQ